MANDQRWVVQDDDLLALSPIKARNLLAVCFFHAQRETVRAARQTEDERAIVDGLATALSMAFMQARVDMEAPTVEGLGKVVEILAQQSRTWGTPPEVIEHHAGQIGRVVARLQQDAQGKAEFELGLLIDADLQAGRLDIPSLPRVAIELHQLSSSMTNDLSHAAQIIRRDPKVAARVLEVANSAAYSRAGGERVTNLDEAAKRIGLDGLKRMAFALTLGAVFRCAPLDAQMRGVQQRAFTVGSGAAFACGLRGMDTDMGFLAGLFHEVGRQLLLARLSRMGAKEPRWLSPDVTQLPFLALHQGLGQRVVEHWGLGAEIASVAGTHHHPALPLAEVVALVDAAEGLPAETAEQRGRLLAAFHTRRVGGLNPQQVADVGRFVHAARQDPAMLALTA